MVRSHFQRGTRSDPCCERHSRGGRPCDASFPRALEPRTRTTLQSASVSPAPRTPPSCCRLFQQTCQTLFEFNSIRTITVMGPIMVFLVLTVFNRIKMIESIIMILSFRYHFILCHFDFFLATLRINLICLTYQTLTSIF